MDQRVDALIITIWSENSSKLAILLEWLNALMLAKLAAVFMGNEFSKAKQYSYSVLFFLFPSLSITQSSHSYSLVFCFGN